MKDEWPKTFFEKLKNELNITCALRVLDKHIKKGERKQVNDFFGLKLVVQTPIARETSKLCSKRMWK